MFERRPVRAARAARAADRRRSVACRARRIARAVRTPPPDGSPSAAAARACRPAGVIRTALCVEPREGRLHVFMPPVGDDRGLSRPGRRRRGNGRRARHARAHRRLPPPERSAAQQLQGHARPRRDRGQHPAGARLGRARRRTRPRSTKRRARRGWAPRSSCSTAATPAPAAATTWCSAAPTPADSPFLRRPDLLRSLVGYWHNHPSLSYLFSGLFIGPTSQASARRRRPQRLRCYELEIAFAQVPRRERRRRRGSSTASSATCSSTHRQHAPRRVLHRQALLARDQQRAAGPGRAARVRDAAARAHEPGAAAAAARARRALLEDALQRTLVRWGTELHDRFMLPHFVARRLRRRPRRPARATAIRSSPSGSRRTSSSASRCMARSRTRGVHVELRQALEPWHVLGEEPGAGGTVALRRFVGRAAAGESDGHDGIAPLPCRATAARCRCIQRAPRASSSPACAIARGSRRAACTRRSACTRRWSSISSTRGTNGRSAAARITSRIPAGGASTTFPVNAYEAEGAGGRAFFDAIGHTPGRDERPRPRIETRTSRSRSTFDARRRRALSTGTSSGCDERIRQYHAAVRPGAPVAPAADYRPAGRGVTTRCSTAPGTLRQHCEGFVAASKRIGADEFAARRDNAQRAIRENGVTYNVYGDPQGIDRPWELDMVPLVVSARRVGAARARPGAARTPAQPDPPRPHGPQRLLRRGLLPPPAGARPTRHSCARATASRCRTVSICTCYGVDLARARDGDWWVLADRTQAPSGAGYALENRLVLLT